jgi:hypothetical protein
MTSAQRLARSAASVLCVFSALCCASPETARAADEQLFPFAPGEKLRYEVYWAGIKAAEAMLEIMPMTAIEGRAAWHFAMSAETMPLAAAIYPVHDRMDSWADADMEHALRYTELKRKRFETKNLSISFDWQSNTARTAKNEKKRLVALKPGAFDPLSIFYFFRTQELHENRSLTRPVADRKRCMQAVAHVRGRETVRSGGRLWDAWLVEPELRSIEGVFKKNPHARLQIWVSADERRLPVLVKSKVAVGSFTAELVYIERPQPPVQGVVEK